MILGDEIVVFQGRLEVGDSLGSGRVSRSAPGGSRGCARWAASAAPGASDMAGGP